MKAVKIIKPGLAEVVDAPVPQLPSPDYILVKTVAVALNPSDWKHVRVVKDQVTVGLDYAGVVQEVNPTVADRFKKGDRVAGFVIGSNSLHPDNGAFAEYVAAKAGALLKIPDTMSFEDAAGLGVGIVTVGQGLYQEMQLPWPDQPLKEKKSILIYGGSSAMGAFGIQFAKLSGFEVITTCSPKNFDYVKSLGADHVFNAYDADVGKKINKFTNNTLYYAWDCISEKGAPQQCADALASSAPPGQEIRYGNLAGPQVQPRDDIICNWSIGYSAHGEDWVAQWTGEKTHVPGKPEHWEWYKKWVLFAEKLLHEGKFRPHRVEFRKGGFEGIPEGLNDLKDGKVSGAKLVYRVGSP